MSNIKFIYDEKDIKDVKILFEGEKDKELMGTIKIFCVDSIPQEYKPEVTEAEDYFMVKSENGEKVLEHILRFTYLTTKFAEKMGDQIKIKGFKPEDLDFSPLKEDIEVSNNTDWRGLIELLGGTLTKDEDE